MTHGPLCNGCVLQREGGTGFALLDGKGTNGILLVGEALGKDEVPVGKPFQGGAGRVLDRMLSRRIDPGTNHPLNRDDFLIANVVNCRPPDNALTKTPWEMEAIDRCSPYLIQTLTKHKPKVIVALGNQALRWFTGEWGIEKLRGYIFPTKWGPVIGTYHPAYIMRGKFPLARVFQQDILKAIYVSHHGVPVLKKEYILYPTIQDFISFLNAYKRHGMPLLSWDIETPYSRKQKDNKDEGVITEKFVEDDPSYRIILRISFAWEPGKAITVPWSPPYTTYIKELLELSGDKLLWNKNFDVPRVQSHGIKVGGRIYDGMDAFHFLEPTFPMGLKYAATFFCPDMHAWKLESRDRPEWYNAADSDVALRCFLGTKSQLVDQGRWNTFERHFVDLSMVLRAMSDRGVLVDRDEREAQRLKFEGFLKDEVANLQPMVPDAVRPKKVYKSPKERLVKQNKWVEGSMVEITVQEPFKPPKEKKVKVKAPKKARVVKPTSSLSGAENSPPRKRGRPRKVKPTDVPSADGQP